MANLANLADKRWMDIDESSEDVKYTGNWFVDSYDKPGPFRAVGSLSGQSAHGIASEGGFSFSFEGTDFDVRGQSSVVLISTNGSIRCTIDSVEGQTDVADAANFRNFRLCFGRGLSAGRHEVVVQITPGPNTVVWVDTVTYYSLAYPNIRRKQSKLTPDTPEFRFTGAGWLNPFASDEKGTHGRETFANGDRVIIPFFGTSVELWSYLVPDMPRVAGSVAYSLDGSTPVRVEIPIWTPRFRGAGADEYIWNRVMQTPPVAPGHHTLEIVNLGNPSTVPLAVDYFLVSHGNIDNPTQPPDRPGQVIATSSPISSPTPTPTPTPQATSSSRKTAIAPIVGGVMGGIAVLACIAFLIYFYISRRRRSGKDEHPSRLTIEETAALLMSSRDLAVATAPYNTEPTPNAFDGTPSLLPPPPFMTPAQRVMDSALRGTDTKRKPFTGRAPPPPPVEEPPPRFSREYADSMASLYTNAAPTRLVPLRRESDNDEPLLTPSPPSKPSKKGGFPRQHTTN